MRIVLIGAAACLSVVHLINGGKASASVIRRRVHMRIYHAERLENVFLDIIAELLAGYDFDESR